MASVQLDPHFPSPVWQCQRIAAERDKTRRVGALLRSSRLRVCRELIGTGIESRAELGRTWGASGTLRQPRESRAALP